MKLLYYFIILLIVVSCDTDKCEPESGRPLKPVYIYDMAFHFKDKAGNDLASPLAEEQWRPENYQGPWSGQINPERYSLEIKSVNPDKWIHRTFWGPIFVSEYDPHLLMVTAKDYSGYLLYNEVLLHREYGLQNYLTYRISCSTIFKDNSEHYITAYWNNNPEDIEYPECTKVLFDEQEVEVRKYLVNTPGDRNYYVYISDIVLEQ